jgi:glycosyltransferase involved in cell wall biosynthesis
VIKGGVDGRFFTPPARPPVRDRVLYVGRLVAYKSVDQLIRALPPDLPLTVCGRPYHAHYFQLLQELAAGKQVEFILDADDETIRQLYRRAWVNVLPTRYEDCYGGLQPAPELMGLTLLEAMACGTPAICFRAGAMPEFVRHGETGFVFDRIDELTAHLRFLADNPPVVERLGRQARRVIEQEFDYRVVGARLLDLYEGLLARGWEAAA